MRSILLALLAFLAFQFTASAQQVVAPAGGSFQGNSLSVEWTLGETVTGTLTGDDYILTQGFHQSSFTVTSVAPEIIPGIMVNAFPNPANDFLKITLQGDYQQVSGLYFYDMSGRLMLHDQMQGQSHEISLSSLKSGIYFLKVMAGSQEVKTFKIVKN